MRVTAISHSCVTDVNQQLYAELSNQPNVSVDLVVPSSWRSEYSGKYIDPGLLSGGGFRLYAHPVIGAGALHTHLYQAGFSHLIRSSKPDVLFVDEEPWSFAMAQALMVSRRIGVPLVAYTKQNISKRYPPPFRWIEQATYRRSSAIAVISDEVRDVLRQKGYTGHAPLLEHGCDLSLFHPRESQSLRQELGLTGMVAGYMGRLVPEKGLDTLIQALELLAAKCPEIPFSCLMVGSGPHEADLRLAAREAGVAERVRFAGAVPHSQAGDYMACMDVLVLPSRTTSGWKEQFGRVIVEALASGAAVIGSDSGQIPHLISKTGGGLVFHEGDASGLAGAIETYLRRPELRMAAAEAGRRSVQCYFTYRAIAADLLSILSSAAGVPGLPAAQSA